MRPELQQKNVKVALREGPPGRRIASPRVRAWRGLTARTYALGALLTLLTVTLDWGGRLSAVERWFYDQRARHCQYFTPPPPDRLVHVDIDDVAIETIGRWPWPRTTLAEVVDELRLAGADALSIDILLSDPSKLEASQRPDGVEVVDHDANLAAAFGRFGRVLVPVSFTFALRATPTPGYSALVNVLRHDLELPMDEAYRQAATAAPGQHGRMTEDEFLEARRQAISERLLEAQWHGTRPLESLRGELFPHAADIPGAAALMRELEHEYARSTSAAQMDRFTLPAPVPAPKEPPPAFLPASAQTAMIPALARVAWCSGYVDYLPRPDDATIRAIPLCVTYHDRLYPQMDLAFACAVLGVDPHTIRISRGEIVLPRPEGGPIVIPVHDVPSDVFGPVSMFVDIPFSGTSAWQPMYDYPRYQQIKRHIPITLLLELADARKTITRNNAEADKAAGFFAEAGVDSAKAFLKNPPGTDRIDARNEGLAKILAEASVLAAPVQGTAPAALSDEDKAFLNALDAVRRALSNNRADVPRFERKAAEMRAALKGKAVLIGATSTAVGDQSPTPLHSNCPGVVIHGVIFNAIISGHFWRTAPAWVSWLITLAAGALTTAIVVRLAPLKAMGLTLLLAGGYLAINGLLLFDYGNWIVGLAGPLLATTLVWAALTLTRLVVEAQERARITRRFQSYVDPTLVKYVIEHPELARLEGEVREMTVVFTDLAGFTSFAEKLREKAVKILGRYISRMVPPIRRHNGLLHKFMGDGIMFSYGAPIANPNQATDAVLTVLEMQQELERLNEELTAEGYPRLAMRAGVNTGMAVVGDSGADDASEYACLGDTTNLAARLESANKAVGTHCLLSARTVEQLAARFLVRPIGRLVVAGKTQSVMTYEPLGPRDAASDIQKRLAEMTTVMVDHFTAARFKECLAATDEVDAAFGSSKLTGLYRVLCRSYLIDPPEEFKGEIVLEGK